MIAFDDCFEKSLAAIRGFAAGPVIYHAGSHQIPLYAVEGLTNFKAETGGGLTLRATMIDFMFAVAHLVIDGQPIEPTPGHWIEKHNQRYELAELGEEGCYRYSDPNRSEYRVHTNRAG